MKKCLLLYGKHNIDDLFNSCHSKINLHGLWISLRNKLYSHNIEIVSKEFLGLKLADLEIHINAQETEKNMIPKFAILTECEFIDPRNSNIDLLKKYNHIFSWNPNLVDLGLATKIQIAHPLGKGIVDGYKDRNKLVVLFGSNRNFRNWNHKKNLYNERVKTIRWFENNVIKDFSLYGKKWNLTARLPSRIGALFHSIEKRIPFKKKPFPSWKGEILDKQEILKKSRFSIVYENIRDVKGYITEKIFDAFVAGNIPIYWGAPDINDYVPKDCFIDRREFSNHQKLYEFIKKMPEDQYLNYQRRIKDFLENKSEKFSCDQFSNIISSKIIEVINN
jgi:hypothetical protein